MESTPSEAQLYLPTIRKQQTIAITPVYKTSMLYDGHMHGCFVECIQLAYYRFHSKYQFTAVDTFSAHGKSPDTFIG